jgi:hypothetical protein
MKIYIENGQAHPVVQALPDADPAPVGYTLTEDIVDAHKYGARAVATGLLGWGDRMCVRTKIKDLIYIKMGIVVNNDLRDQAKWDLLTVQEKKIACKYFIVSKDSFFAEVENDDRYWVYEASKYRVWSMKARKIRADLADSILFMRMYDVGDAKLLMADMRQIAFDTEIIIDGITNKTTSPIRIKSLRQQYIEGLESNNLDGVPGIRDWIRSASGTPFQNSGFMQVAYTLKGGHTLGSVRDEMLAALDGEY